MFLHDYISIVLAFTIPTRIWGKSLGSCWSFSTTHILYLDMNQNWAPQNLSFKWFILKIDSNLCSARSSIWTRFPCGRNHLSSFKVRFIHAGVISMIDYMVDVIQNSFGTESVMWIERIDEETGAWLGSRWYRGMKPTIMGIQLVGYNPTSVIAGSISFDAFWD